MSEAVRPTPITTDILPSEKSSFEKPKGKLEGRECRAIKQTSKKHFLKGVVYLVSAVALGTLTTMSAFFATTSWAVTKGFASTIIGLPIAVVTGSASITICLATIYLLERSISYTMKGLDNL